MLVLGIDPGLNGGLAIIQSGPRPTILGAYEIPVVGEKAKRRISVHEVLQILRSWPQGIAHAFVERAQAMPEQGASSGFIYGRAVGALEAAVEAFGIPITIIEPTAWKKASDLVKADKEASRQRAIQLFPGSAGYFPRKKDHGLAEAALIARAGLKTLGSLAEEVA